MDGLRGRCAHPRGVRGRADSRGPRRPRDPRDPSRPRARGIGHHQGTQALTVTIRTAEPADAEAIAALYNLGIAERQATFETRPRAADEVAAWFEPGLPFLVAEDADGRVLGFARVSPYSDRCVYEGVGEHGVYVGGAARGQGLGRKLLDALAAEAEQRGLYKLTSRIFTTNEASRAAHRAAHFEEVGVQRRHGRLDGEWKDCVLVERLLGEAADDS
jgi:phosphinothricin acetyltransferase